MVHRCGYPPWQFCRQWPNRSGLPCPCRSSLVLRRGRQGKRSSSPAMASSQHKAAPTGTLHGLKPMPAWPGSAAGSGNRGWSAHRCGYHPWQFCRQWLNRSGVPCPCRSSLVLRIGRQGKRSSSPAMASSQHNAAPTGTVHGLKPVPPWPGSAAGSGNRGWSAHRCGYHPWQFCRQWLIRSGLPFP